MTTERIVKLRELMKKEGFALEVLSYHEYGKDKWEQNGMIYKVHNAFVSETQFGEFCEILKNNSIRLVRT